MSLDVWFASDIARVIGGLALTADVTITDERERAGYGLALRSVALALGVELPALPVSHRQTVERAEAMSVAGLGESAKCGTWILEKTNGR